MSRSFSVGIIGAGISGMAAAIELAGKGVEVHVFEKNKSFGGRGHVVERDGFKFDMGPSWYWMPDLFEEFFQSNGRSIKEYFELVRLDPSFRLIYQGGSLDVPAGMEACCEVFEKREPGSSRFLKKFISEGKYKYETGMRDFVRKPALSLMEFLDWRILKGIFRLQMFQSIERVVFKGIKDPVLRQWLCFPVLFLGAKPSDTPALYSLMNYAEIELGTWYPKGGMVKLFEAFYKLACEKGVHFHFESEVSRIDLEGRKVRGLVVNERLFAFDSIIASADYHHVESMLLPPDKRQYSETYWQTRLMAPSSLIFYLGMDGPVEGLLHHNLFFDADFDEHAAEIYDHPAWPSDPLFYVCVTSKSDPSVAPPGKENVFILIPLAAGIQDDTEMRNMLFEKVILRMEQKTGQSLRNRIQTRMEMGPSDFERVYHSFKGNAYGLANTLGQTALLKPRIKHKKLDGLYYAGQLAHPGPGLPPSMISGQNSAKLIIKEHQL